MTTWIATHRGLRALAARETARVLKLWTQTIAAPILSSALFILVFGLSLGDRIKAIDGFPYDQYIVPGLIAMAMAQAAYSNNSTCTPAVCSRRTYSSASPRRKSCSAVMIVAGATPYTDSAWSGDAYGALRTTGSGTYVSQMCLSRR